MDDSFRVVPERVTAVSQVLGDKEETPRQLAGKLDRAGTVDTGDQGLNSSVRDMVTQLTTLLGQFGGALRHDAEGLRSVVDRYQSADDDVATALDQIADSLKSGSSDQPAVPVAKLDPPGQPTSRTRIADKLNMAS